MKRKSILAFVLLTIVINTVSCDQIDKIKNIIIPEKTESVTEMETDIDTEAVTDATPAVPEKVDPLTGEISENDFSTSRPVAIVVKNDRVASPQYGLSKASVLYEALVEGGMTRFMAVYSDVSLTDRVGPVIDTRTYFYDFAINHGAAIVQAGTTKKSAIEQKARGITALDAVNGELTPGFFRDEILTSARGYENSILTNANGIKARAIQSGVTLSTSSRVSPYTVLDYKQKRELNDASYCTYLCIPFSNNMSVEYKYSTLNNKYSRSQYGEPHKDAVTAKQLAFTNLIVLLMDYEVIDMSTGEMGIKSKGSGNGFYIYGGSRVMIKWEKEDSLNPVKLYENDGLTPLKVAAGNTYVAIVPQRISGKIEFEKK